MSCRSLIQKKSVLACLASWREKGTGLKEACQSFVGKGVSVRNSSALMLCLLRSSWKAGRLSSMALAARLMLPCERRSASISTRRSASFRAAYNERVPEQASPSRSKSAAVIRRPWAMMTARLMRFSSSRTLPGQVWDSMASTASVEKGLTLIW